MQKWKTCFSKRISTPVYNLQIVFYAVSSAIDDLFNRDREILLPLSNNVVRVKCY